MLRGSGRAISFSDYFCFRSVDVHDTDGRFRGRFDERTTILIPFYEFPMVPPVSAGVISPLSLAVPLPRIAQYIGNTENAEGTELREG